MTWLPSAGESVRKGVQETLPGRYGRAARTVNSDPSHSVTSLDFNVFRIMYRLVDKHKAASKDELLEMIRFGADTVPFPTKLHIQEPKIICTLSGD